MRDRRLLLTGYFFLLFWMLAGCSNEDATAERENLPPELEFTIDAALLGEPYRQEDYQIGLQAPKTWERVSEEVLQQLRERMASEFSEQDVGFHLIDVFWDTEKNCLLHLAHIKHITGQAEGETNALQAYRALLLERLDASQLKEGEFAKDGERFVQFLIQDGQYVTFKLLVYNSKQELLELDYIVPATKYSSTIVKAIESSIGTVTLLH